MSKPNALSVIDKGYAWVIFGSGIVIYVATSAAFYTVGLMRLYFIESIDAERSVLSALTSLHIICMYLSGLFTGALVDIFGCRLVCLIGAFGLSIGLFISALAENIITMYTGYGVLQGFGMGICWLVTLIVIAQYFERYRSTVLAITCASAPLTGMVSPIIVQKIHSNFGWRSCLFFFCAFNMHIIPASLLMRPLNQLSTNKQPVSNKPVYSVYKDLFKKLRKLLDFKILTQPSFVMVFVAQLLVLVGRPSSDLLLPQKARLEGLSYDSVAIIVSTVNLTDAVVRVIFCVVVLFLPPKCRHIIWICAHFTFAMVNILTIFYSSMVLFMMASVLLGLSNALIVSLRYIVLVDFFGVEQFSRTVGYVSLASGVGYTCGSTIVAYVSDGPNGMLISFLMLGGVQLISGFLLALHFVVCRKLTHLSEDIQQVNESVISDSLKTKNIISKNYQEKNSLNGINIHASSTYVGSVHSLVL